MTELDQELAEATDALLDGRAVKTLAGENGELQAVVRRLYQVIDPHGAPSAEFERRLTNRLSAEWDQAYARPKLRLIERPWARVVGLAAAVVLVLAALVVLAVPDPAAQLQGRAVGVDDAVAFLVLIGVALAGAFVYWRGRR